MPSRKNTLFHSDEGQRFDVREKLFLLKIIHPDVFNAFIAKCKNPQFVFHGKQQEILYRWSTSYEGFLSINGNIPESVRTITLNSIRETETGEIEVSAMGGLIRSRL